MIHKKKTNTYSSESPFFNQNKPQMFSSKRFTSFPSIESLHKSYIMKIANGTKTQSFIKKRMYTN